VTEDDTAWGQQVWREMQAAARADGARSLLTWLNRADVPYGVCRWVRLPGGIGFGWETADDDTDDVLAAWQDAQTEAAP